MTLHTLYMYSLADEQGCVHAGYIYTYIYIYIYVRDPLIITKVGARSQLLLADVDFSPTEYGVVLICH